MTVPNAETVARRMESLLPEDGTPVLNRVMRVMLSRDLQTIIEPELYFAARDLLLIRKRIGRLRGQGGQIFLTIPETETLPEVEEQTAEERWAERRLMSPLEAYLNGSFRKGLDLPSAATFLVRDTSTIGPRRGRWARPDFIVVSAMEFKYLPGKQVDVHSFELKTEAGGTAESVYEALAHTRFTHFGHLVWHLPRESRAEARLAEVESHCEEHGVGLIRMFDPNDPHAFEILLDPVRKPTRPLAVDGFLDSRLDAAQQSALIRAVHGVAR